MMDAILQSTVWLIQAVVHYSVGAVLLALAVVGVVAAARWWLDPPHAEPSGRSGPVLRRGFAFLPAAALLAGLGCLGAVLAVGLR
jgi:hypothetical protein